LVALLNLFDRFLKLGFLFSISIFIGRYLGPSALGQYSLYSSIILVLATLINGGSDILISREFSRKDKLSYSISFAIFFRIALFSIISVIVFLTDIFEITFSYKVIIIIVLAAGVTNFTELYYTPRGEIKKLIRYTIFISLPFFILKIFGIYFLKDISSKFIFDIIETIIISIFFIIIFLRRPKSNLKLSKIDKRYLRNWILNILPLWANAIFIILYTKADLFILSNYLGFANLGMYSALTQLASIILIPLSAIISTKLSLLLTYKKNQNEIEFNRTLKSYTILFFLISVLWSGFLYFGSAFLLEIFFGKKFIGCENYLFLYSSSLIFNSIGMVAGQWVIVEKLYWIPMYRSIIGLLVNIFLNVILIPIYGIYGACISSIITSFFTNFLLYYFSSKGRKIFLIQIDAFKKPMKYLKIS
jgi:O-antigen/teichoic acid export membrane protein